MLEVSAAVQWGAVYCTSLVALWSDLRCRRISNRILSLSAAGAVLWSLYTGGAAALAGGMASCTLMAFPFVVLFAFASGGAGDAKLMAVLGLWLGLKNSVVVLPLVVFCGALTGLVYAWRAGRLDSVFRNLRAWPRVVLGRSRRREHAEGGDEAGGAPPQVAFPYGVAVFAGVLAASIAKVLKWY